MVYNKARKGSAETMNELSKNLIALREKAGITQSELAKKSGIHQQSISSYETHGVRPGFDALKKLATALNVSISDIDPYFDYDYRRKPGAGSTSPSFSCALTGREKCPFDGASGKMTALVECLLDADDELVEDLLLRALQQKKGIASTRSGSAGESSRSAKTA